MGPPNKQLIKKQVKYKKPSTKSMRDQANEFASIKKKKKPVRQANEFAGLGSGSKSKRIQANEFVGIKKKKTIRQADEFAGLGKTKTKTDKKKTKTVKAPVPPPSKPKAKISALASLDRKKNKKTPPTSVDSASFKSKPKRERGPKVSVPGSMKDGPPQKVGTTKQKKVEPTKQKKLSFFEKIMSDTKKNFSGDFKKGTGRYKSISTGKTNFNKKKKKLPKQIRV